MSRRGRLCIVLGVMALTLAFGSFDGRSSGVARAEESYPIRWVRMDMDFDSNGVTTQGIAYLANWRECGTSGITGVVVADPKLMRLDLPEGEGGPDDVDTYKANLASFLDACRNGSDPIDFVPLIAGPSRSGPRPTTDPASWCCHSPT